MEGGKHGRTGAGGVHNPSNRLPAGERRQSVIPPFIQPCGFVSQHSAGYTVVTCFHLIAPLSLALFLVSDDPVAMIPVVQRSVGSSAVHVTPVSFFVTLLPVFLLLLH